MKDLQAELGWGAGPLGINEFVLFSFVTAFIISLSFPLLWISIYDIRYNEIPDAAIVMVSAFGVFHVLTNPIAASAATIFVAAAILFVFGRLSQIYWIKFNREALGLGDVKLLAAGTLVVGAENFWMMLLLASTGGLVAAFLGRIRRNEGIPFGPFIAYGILVTVIVSGPMP